MVLCYSIMFLKIGLKMVGQISKFQYAETFSSIMHP
jgi:hypothetical protein